MCTSCHARDLARAVPTPLLKAAAPAPCQLLLPLTWPKQRRDHVAPCVYSAQARAHLDGGLEADHAPYDQNDPLPGCMHLDSPLCHHLALSPATTADTLSTERRRLWHPHRAAACRPCCSSGVVHVDAGAWNCTRTSGAGHGTCPACTSQRARVSHPPGPALASAAMPSKQATRTGMKCRFAAATFAQGMQHATYPQEVKAALKTLSASDGRPSQPCGVRLLLASRPPRATRPSKQATQALRPSTSELI